MRFKTFIQSIDPVFLICVFILIGVIVLAFLASPVVGTLLVLVPTTIFAGTYVTTSIAEWCTRNSK